MIVRRTASYLTSRFYMSSQVEGGNLFTWGRNTSSLGYKVSSQTTQVATPQQLKGFTNNVSQVQMGPNHSALVTCNGEMFTWGNGSTGALGHNDDKSYEEPKLIDFFVKNNLKVVQIALGEYHTVALTHDGDVWTWGYGGREQNFLMDLLFLKVGALGHGDLKTRYTPTPVQFLRNLPPVTKITSGFQFVTIINKNNEMYNWGKGDYGVFGDGENKSLKLPQKNLYFEDYLKKVQKLEIVKIKSCNNYTLGLFSDGNLYGWGSNEAGQMGIKNEIGVEIYETAQFPTAIVTEDFGKTKVVDFWVGEDITAYLLDNNTVFWSGIRMAYKPEKLKLPEGISKIKFVGTCHRCIVVVTEDGKVYFKNKYVQEEKEDLQTGIRETTVQKLFGGGNLLGIGGMYRNRWAIVKQ